MVRGPHPRYRPRDAQRPCATPQNNRSSRQTRILRLPHQEESVPAESHSEVTASARLETTSMQERRPPPWFAQLVLIARWFEQRNMLTPINEALHFRRRVDATAALDVVLLMLAALIGQRSIAATFDALVPVMSALPSLWARKRLLSRSAISRLLAALTAHELDKMQSLFCLRFASTACATSARAA